MLGEGNRRWGVNSLRLGKKGTGTFCRNGPSGASHKRCLSPFPAQRRLKEITVGSRRTTEHDCRSASAAGATADSAAGSGSDRGERPAGRCLPEALRPATRSGCFYRIEVLPLALANTLGDQALIDAILSQGPAIVGFSCYVWNVERTLWIADRLKQRRPELVVLVGGPEVTADNTLVTGNPAIDYAIFGEGETAVRGIAGAIGGDARDRDEGRPDARPSP